MNNEYKQGTQTRDTVVGLFPDERTAQAVVDDLLRNGFRANEVHISSGTEYAGDVASGGAGLTGRAPAQHQSGGFMGWLESLFGGDEDYARVDRSLISDAVKQGRCVVAVDADDARRGRVVDIMNDHDAIDLDKHAGPPKTSTGDRTRTDLKTASGTRETSRTAAGENAERTIPVVQEELQIGKRTVERGGVRVYTHVVNEPVEKDVQLRGEKVTVDRREVNRPITDADRNALREQTFEVKGTTEETVINKQARVVEEVTIGKEATQRTEKVRDTVRRTEVETEKIGAGTNRQTDASNDYNEDFRRDFQTRYANSGRQYETYAPAYEYGYRMAGDSRYSDRNWNDVESNLRTDYARNNPGSTWDEVKDAVHHGWDKVTGKNTGQGSTRDSGDYRASGDYNEDFRRDFQTRFANSGRQYETYAPAYEYGYRMAGDSRYSGRNWNDVESNLRTDYARNNPGSTWDEVKDAVHHGWDKVTGKR